MKLKSTLISLTSILVVGLTAILLYCFWPAIKGTVNNSKYYTQEELQNSYDKGYDDGCKSEIELTGQVKYYKGLVDEYYIQVNTLNDEITMLTNNNKDYEIQISNIENQKANLQTQVDNLTTIKTNNETTIASLNSQITSLQNQVTNLTKSGENKNEQIIVLNNQITTLQNTVLQLQTTIDMDVSTITSLNTQIANLNTQISDITLQFQNSQSHINVFNNKISELQASITYYESYIAQLENSEQVVATFEFDGSVYNIQIVNKGSSLSVTTPISTDYKIFNGWIVNGSAIDLNTFVINTNTKIVADVTYKYDVKFIVDNKVVDSQIVTKNNCAMLPTNPIKDGYEFDGWSTDGVYVISDITTRQVSQNVTYTAVFTKVYNVTFINEDNVISIQMIRNGEYAVSPSQPSKPGYLFTGWTINSLPVELTSYKITNDVVFNSNYSQLTWKETNSNIYTSNYVIQFNSKSYTIIDFNICVFEKESLKWNILKSIPHKVANSFVKLWTDNYNIYVYLNENYTNIHYIYNINSNELTNITIKNSFTSLNLLFNINDKIYFCKDNLTYVFNSVTQEFDQCDVAVTPGLVFYYKGKTYCHSYDQTIYVYNSETNVWEDTGWAKLKKGVMLGTDFWTYDNVLYFSYNDRNYYLDETTNSFIEISWTGLSSLYRANIWTDGINVYYCYKNVSTSTITCYILSI